MGTRLSIGLPVYNGERYLPAALDSLLGQTYADFELIISDNASTDATDAICRRYAALDGRIQYVRSEYNRGATWNYNRVFALASGEYFKWAAHDDWCAPRFFEGCVEILDRHPPVVLCYPRTAVIDEQGQSTGYYPDKLDLRDPRPAARYSAFHEVYRRAHSCNPIFGVFRRQVLAATPLIGNYVSTDMVLLGEISLWGQFYELPEALFYRRDHPLASVRAYPDYRDRIAWFDPRKKGKLELTRWRWLREYLGGIRRAPLAADERLACYGVLARWIGWNRRGLAKDLVKAGLWPVLRLHLGAPPPQPARSPE